MTSVRNPPDSSVGRFNILDTKYVDFDCRFPTAGIMCCWWLK